MTLVHRREPHSLPDRLAAAGGVSLSLLVLGLSLVSLALSTPAAAQPESFKTRVAALNTKSGQSIGAAHIAAPEFLQRFYAKRNFRPAWSDQRNITALKNEIAVSWIDGLLPEDFHANEIGAGAESGILANLTDGERELLLSDSLVRLLYQLFYGKVSPASLDGDWNFERHLPTGDPVELISNALDNGAVSQLVRRARLQHPAYLELRAALQTYTEYDVRGGWPALPDGPVLKPGETDPRLTTLRQRLSITGQYANEASGDPTLYDSSLVDAVKTFQRGHGLDVDGVLGPATIRALNVTARQRVDQIRANLERARWVIRTLLDHKDFVLVNIAGFYLRLILDGKPAWKTDVITGKPYHKTPVFTQTMKYVVLNPDWTVPRSIARNEIFPKAKANPNYLVSANFKLVAGSGAQVNPLSLNWSGLTARSFPYTVVQRPGPNNALGLVKFMFPNRHSVYLHDTPSRQLFDKTGRAFSHGCIRVRDPLKLAEIILGNRAKSQWTRQRIDDAITSKRMQRVNLAKPLMVAILYWTVDPGVAGNATFYEDVYKRDKRLIAALNAPFRPTQR